jgi:hypothetical protein
LTVVAEHTGGPGAWEKRSEQRKAVNRDNATTLLGQIKEQCQRRLKSDPLSGWVPVET